METTSISLLERLRQPGQDQAWGRFVTLYTPLLLFWARRHGLKPTDAADLVQEVFLLLVQKLPEFVYDQQKSFRSWLRMVALNKWRDRQRRHAPPLANDAELSDLVSPQADAFWESEHRQFLVQRALKLMQEDFEAATWKACWEFVVEGKNAAEVAKELGISENAVYIAKCRVLRRLRQELDGLLD
jgi:RNA polymerase sigma-70 factor (ECF subfamily)